MNNFNCRSIIFIVILFFFNSIYADNNPNHLTILREDNSSIVYHLSVPKDGKEYPLIILCEGSYAYGEPIKTVLRLHRMFLRLLEEHNYGLLTLEKWGVDEDKVDCAVFHKHNTRSQRIKDHQQVLNNLNPQNTPGWNGKYIFIGGSEGGDIITALTLIYAHSTLATVNFAGIGAWNWEDELWAFLLHFRKHSSLLTKLYAWWSGFPKTREQYNKVVEEVKKNPTHEKWWIGQTHKYMADAFLSKVDWDAFYNLKIPMLVVMGSLDPAIDSCDEFISKAMSCGMPITCWRLNDVDHAIGNKRPKIFAESVEWLMKAIEL